MALPNDKISIPMVARELGTTENDLGRLCIHPNVNKWSRWKPVRNTKVTGLTEGDLQSVNFGLSTPAPSSNYSSVVSSKWIYNKPGGGATQPFRLGDFRNYGHDSIAICRAPASVNYNSLVSMYIISQLMINISGSDTLIGLNELSGSLGNLYYCIVITVAEGSWIVTADTTLANGGDTIEKIPVPVLGTSGKTGTVSHLLCTAKIDDFTPIGSIGTNTYYPLPSADGETNISTYKALDTALSGDTVLSIKGIGVSNTLILDNIDDYVGIDKPPFNTMGRVYLKLRITNNGSTSGGIMLHNLYMRAMPTYHGTNMLYHKADAFVNGNKVLSITVPSGQYVDFIVGKYDLMNLNGLVPTTPVYGTEVHSTVEIYQYQQPSYNRIIGTSLTFKAQ